MAMTTTMMLKVTMTMTMIYALMFLRTLLRAVGWGQSYCRWGEAPVRLPQSGHDSFRRLAIHNHQMRRRATVASCLS